MLTISGAAKQWGVGRETIYRKQRAGEFSWASAEPPMLDPAERPRPLDQPPATPHRERDQQAAAFAVRRSLA